MARIFLVRHGKASKDMTKYASDDVRPLTKRGRADVEQIAAQLAAAQVEVQQIRHSGILRAHETAEILGQHLNPPGGVIEVKGLRWEDPVEPLAREAHLEPDPVMFVGHNPFMEDLTALLLAGTKSDLSPVTFKTSAAACLDYIAGKWTLVWLLCPDAMPVHEEK